ncbi:MAG: hypothetical protein PHU25_16645 [Deltaproteobacteria bacterium]|nr:hypothetical protein [Deltaproteobacteria bacterium]
MHDDARNEAGTITRAVAAVAAALAVVSMGLRAEAVEPARPVLAVIRVTGDPSSEAHEQRFVDELTLVLADMRVDVKKMEVPGYARLPLTEQMAAVEPLFARKEAAAVAWLSEMSPGRFVLCVVVWGTGRAMVRILEAGASEGFETDLALAAAELLGSAYLFEPPLRREDPMRGVADAARKKVVATGLADSPEPPSAEGREVSLWAAGAFESGVAGGHGPRLAAGGALALEMGLAAGLSGRVAVTLLGGPFDETRSASIHALHVAPGLGVLYLWSLGPFDLGPSLDVGARRSVVAVDSEAGDAKAFQTWQAMGAVALEARWRFARPLSLALSLGLVATPQQDLYRLERTGEDVFATWRLGVFARLGLVLHMKT